MISPRAFSPRKPMAMEASVMPTWQADRYSSMLRELAEGERGSALALLGVGLHPVALDANECELGGDEEAVEADEQSDREEEEGGGHRTSLERERLPLDASTCALGAGSGELREGASSLMRRPSAR
jgi:hypothetical protein